MCVESLNADVNIDVIHSDLSPAARNEAITRFRTGVSWVLIATDLLGRGLDFLGLNTVVIMISHRCEIRGYLRNRVELTMYIA